MALRDWSTTAASNNAAVPGGAPEGWAPSEVNNVLREVMAQVRGFAQDAQWFDYGDATTTSRINGTSFSLTGTHTATYAVGRRVEFRNQAGTSTYGTITDQTLTGGNTQVTVVNDSGSLTGTTSAILLGIHTPTSSAFPSGLAIGQALPTTPDGQLHIHSGSAGTITADTNADELVLEGSGDAGLTILAGNASNAAINFGDDGDANSGYIDYDHNTNLMAIATSGTLAWTCDAAGIVTKSLQPAFLARPAGAQSNIAVASPVTVVFGTEIFDQNADFASNTFTAPVSGRYFLSFSLGLNAIDTACSVYEFNLNTSNRAYGWRIDPGVLASDPTDWQVPFSVVADMDASDTAYVNVYQATGTVQTDIATNSSFSGFLLG